MACVRGDVLFPQCPRGPSVCLSDPHSASCYGADGAGRLLSHTLPLMRKKHWLLCLFAHLMCVACVLYTKQFTFVFIACVCVLARARVELMCFCMFFIFISSRFIRQMGTTCPFPLLPLLLCEGVYFHAISQQALLSLTHIDSFSLKHKWIKPESLSLFHQLLKMTLTCWYWAIADIQKLCGNTELLLFIVL